MLLDPDDAESTDVVQAALSRIQQRVAERRADGAFPAGLEDELDRHYRQVSDTLHGTSAALRNASAATHRLAAVGFSAERFSYASRFPLGGVVHRTIGKVTSRQTQGLIQQMQELSAATRDALQACLETLRESATHTHPQLERRLAYAVDKLASVDSMGDDLAALEARVAKLEAQLPAATD